MKVWRLSDPLDERYASAGWRGTWSSGRLCPGCTASSEQRVSPLLLVWQPGSRTVGDFVWPGRGVVVTESVAEVLSQFGGFDVGPVEIIDDHGPTRGPIRLPEVDASDLRELLARAVVGVDLDRSSVELARTCEVCGRDEWEFFGLSEWRVTWDQEARSGSRDCVPRFPGAGLFVPEAEAVEAGVFTISQAPAWVLCTDEFRHVVDDHGFSNIAFLDVGDTH